MNTLLPSKEYCINRFSNDAVHLKIEGFDWPLLLSRLV